MKPAVRFTNSSTSYAKASPPPTNVHAGCLWGYLASDTNAFGCFFTCGMIGNSPSDELTVDATGTQLIWGSDAGTTNILNLTVGKWYGMAWNRLSSAVHFWLMTEGQPGFQIRQQIITTVDTFTTDHIAWGAWNVNGPFGPGDTVDGRIAYARVWRDRYLNEAQLYRELMSPVAVSKAGLLCDLPFFGKDQRSRVRGNHATFGAGTINSEAGPLGVLARPKRRGRGAVVSAPPPPAGQFWLAAAA